MSDTPHGYGPPRILGVRAVRAGAEERSFAVAPETGGAPPRLRLEIRGEEFPLRAMPLMIQVGDQAHLAFDVSDDGTTVACHLPEIPEEGAVIRVGYPPDDMTELPERFSLSMIEPGGDV